MRRLVPLLAGLLAGCGKYADFTLPAIRNTHAKVSFTWTVRSEPVLRLGAPGEWDSVDALNPSVIRGQSGYLNIYSGFDGKTWHTGVATSADGARWDKKGRVISPDPRTWEGDYIAANGAALRVGNEILYWYQSGLHPDIALARSTDGTSWIKHGAPVLSKGPRGSWDERAVGDPYVIRIDGLFYMYYLGEDRARRQQLGVARSGDGVTWRKYRRNPVLEPGNLEAFDDSGLGEPAVWRQHDSYWMLYTGRDRREMRRLGLARSQDGVHWARVTQDAVLAGTQPWNSKVLCDPTVEVQNGDVRVWFGGGDIAHPAENIHGQIGLATLRFSMQ